MNLVLDAGNTNTKIGIFNHKKLIHNTSTQSFSTDFLEKIIFEYNKINIACVSNTSSSIDYLARIFKKHNIKLINVDNNCILPIEIKYKTPETLGSDRIALAVGAYKKYNNNVLVIDCGTCITYDFMLHNIYMGGQITPGLKIRLQALNNFTENLPSVNFESVIEFIGTTTKDSILSGLYYGVISEINGIIQRYKSRYSNIKIILTGGDAHCFNNKIQDLNFIDPYLLMEGLNHIIATNE